MHIAATWISLDWTPLPLVVFAGTNEGHQKIPAIFRFLWPSANQSVPSHRISGYDAVASRIEHRILLYNDDSSARLAKMKHSCHSGIDCPKFTKRRCLRSVESFTMTSVIGVSKTCNDVFTVTANHLNIAHLLGMHPCRSGSGRV